MRAHDRFVNRPHIVSSGTAEITFGRRVPVRVLVELGQAPVMRPFLPTILLGILASGAANASSFAELTPAGTRISPSIIFLGTPAAPAPDAVIVAQQIPFAPPPALAGAPKPEITQVSPSVIALGLLQPDVDLSRFAAIDEKPRRMRDPHLPPMVIRGGLFGDAFARGAATAAPETKQAAQNPAPATGAAPPKAAPDKHAPPKSPEPEEQPAVQPRPTAKME